jgi:16S rRNA (guanine527-N7)-methyltransferase
MINDENAAKHWIAEAMRADEQTMGRLRRFVDLLTLENLSQNLVSQESLSRVWQRHIVDSLQLQMFALGGTKLEWLDLGTGAGFPGLVLAVFNPELKITLVESRSRRVDWLQRIVDEFALPNVSVEGRRVEQVDGRWFDVISARAFAPLPKLVDLAARFSTAETTWILPKGRSAAQDLASLKGWDHTFHVEQSITDLEAGIITGQLSKRKG